MQRYGKWAVVVSLLALTVLLSTTAVALALLGGIAADDQAKTAVLQFGGLGKPTSVTPTEFAGHMPVREVATSTGRIAWVDPEGQVLGVVGQVATVPIGPNGLTIGEALTAAGDFARSKNSSFARLSLLDSTRTPDGWYAFTWQERSPAGALLPSVVTASVDPSSGAIANYNARYETSALVDQRPGISRQQAEALWREDAGRYDELQEVVLQAVRDKDNQERLIWHISYIEKTPNPGPLGTGKGFKAIGLSKWYDASNGADLTSLMAP